MLVSTRAGKPLARPLKHAAEPHVPTPSILLRTHPTHQMRETT